MYDKFQQEEQEKVYFLPGETVKIRHELDFTPKMLVIGKESKLIKGDNHFKGIKCFWFTLDGLYQEGVFSTKDLIHV